jgi:hypothetical protein
VHLEFRVIYVIWLLHASYNSVDIARLQEKYVVECNFCLLKFACYILNTVFIHASM